MRAKLWFSRQGTICQTPGHGCLSVQVDCPMSLIIMVLIGSSAVATTWLLRRMQHDEFRGAMTRTEQVIDTLLQTQRKTLIQQAKLVGELPILTAVVESGDIATTRDSAQTYQSQLQVPLLDVFDMAGSVLVSLHDAAEEITTVASADLIEAALKGQAQAGLLWRGQRRALAARRPLVFLMLPPAYYKSASIWTRHGQPHSCSYQH